MPSIPFYNQSSTEEAGLTRAKKRVIKLLEQGIVKLTEVPAVDVTGGDANKLCEESIRLMEELTSVFRQVNLLFIERGGIVIVESLEDARKALKLVVIARKMFRRLLSTLKSLSTGISFVDLSLYNQLLSAWKELDEVTNVSIAYLMNIDLDELDDEVAGIWDDVESEYGSDYESIESESVSSRQRTREAFEKIANWEELVIDLSGQYVKVADLMPILTRDFNASRQQRVLPTETVGLEGGVFRKPVYRIGNNVMSSLYQMDGLPRYI